MSYPDPSQATEVDLPKARDTDSHLPLQIDFFEAFHDVTSKIDKMSNFRLHLTKRLINLKVKYK